MKSPKTTLWILKILVMTIGIGLFAGCGKTDRNQTQDSPVAIGPTPQPPNPPGPPVPPDPCTPQSTDLNCVCRVNPNDSRCQTGGGGTGEPITFSGTLSRNNNFTWQSPSFTAETDSIFIVQMNSGPADRIQSGRGYSNYTAEYSMIGYTVTVNQASVQTPLMCVSGAYNCSAPQYVRSDFSGRISRGPITAPLRITVSSPVNDHYCLLWVRTLAAFGGNQWLARQALGGLGPEQLCSPFARPMYRTHTASFSMSVFLNGSGPTY